MGHLFVRKWAEWSLKHLKEYQDCKPWLLQETKLPDICRKATRGDAVWEASEGHYEQLNKGAGLANQGYALRDLLHVHLYLYLLHVTVLCSLIIYA